MDKRVVVLIAEDDDGHAELIQRILNRAGLSSESIRFCDGRELLNFLFMIGPGPHREHGTHYLLLLDIRMPQVDGIEVLREIKNDPELRKLPVIMVTTTDDPGDIDTCYKLGCSNYVTKPIEYGKFIETLEKMGDFVSVVSIPKIE